MSHVRTSPYYPQSNGKLERWHKTLKQDCIRPHVPLSLEDARRHISQTEERCYWVPAPEDVNWVDWSNARFAVRRDDLSTAAPSGALFAPLPASLRDNKRWREMERDWVNSLYREARLTAPRLLL